MATEHPDYPADPGPHRCKLCGQSTRHFTLGDSQRYFSLLCAANGWTMRTDGKRTSLTEARTEEAARYLANREKFQRVVAQARASGEG